MEISSSFNNIQNNKVTSDKNKEAKKNPNLAPLNKDTVSFSGKAKEAAGKTGEENAKEYFDFDFSKIKEIETEAQLTLQDGTTIPLLEYINQILSQDTGFETEEEYRQYILDNFSSNLKMMKQAFQEQQESNGIVSKAYDKLKELTGFGISSEDVEKMITEQEEMLNALTEVNNQSQILFEKIYEQYTGTKYSKEQFDEYLKISNVYSAIMTGCRNDKDFAKNVKKVTGKSVKKLSKEFALAQLDTFGKTASLKIDAEKYAQDKETFKDKLSAIITTTGMGSIVIGAVLSFIFPPAAAAGVGLMMAGKSLSLGGMFVDNVMDLADSATDKDGLTKEELGNLALETGFEAVSYGTGRAIGKFTNGLNNIVTNKTANAGLGYLGSHITGQAAETGVDAAMSLTADYVLAQGQSYITTGQFMKAEDYWSLDRFLTEGRNQLMGILTGVASSKINAFQQGVITTAQAKILEGDTEGAKEHLKKSGMKMTDANFEQFVLSVKEAEAIKTQPESESSSVAPIKTEEHGEIKPEESGQSKNAGEIKNNGETQTERTLSFEESLRKKIEANGKIMSNSSLEKAEYLISSVKTAEQYEIVNRILSDERLFNNPNFMKDAGLIIEFAGTKEKADLASRILSDERLFNNPEFMKYAGGIIYNADTKEKADIKTAMLDKILSDERLFNNPNFMKNAGWIIHNAATKEQADLASRILSDERLFNNPNFMEAAGWIIRDADTKEKADLASRILSDERLFNNPNFMNVAGGIIEYANTKEKADIKTAMLDKILSDERLFNNPNFMEVAGRIIYNANTKEKADIKTAMLDKILSDERLFNNPNFMKNAGWIIHNAATKEQADLASRILSDERLFNNPNFMEVAGRIIRDADTKEKADLASRILSDERLFNNPNFMKDAGLIIYNADTKEKADLASCILSDERLFNNPNFMRNAGWIIKYANTKEQADIKTAMLDKILSDERLFNNPNFMNVAGEIIYNANTKEKADIKTAMLDKILSDERLFNNPNFMKNAGWIIHNAATKEQADLASRILSDERLFNNPNFMKDAGLIIYNADTKEKADIKTAMLDKILSDERLFNNPNFMKDAGVIIEYANTKEKADLASRILSDERLFNNPEFMKYAGGIIWYANTKEKADLASRILSDERLFNNPNFMRVADEIIKYANTKEKADIKTAMLDKILSDERLFNNPNFMNVAGWIIEFADTKEQAEKSLNILDNYLQGEILSNQILSILNDSENHISIAQLKKVNRVLGKKQAGRLSASDTVIAATFTDLYGKNNINEIPIYKKRELLRKLVAANSNLFNQSEEMQKLFPLLPKNQEEYCTLLPSIVKSLGIETNSLTSGEVKAFESSMSNLSSTLKGISDSSFKDLTITQEYPKDIFIKDILDKVKDLSPSERQKVYDYFGFELHKNTRTNTGFYITGYPVNLNNGKKLAQITDTKTKEVVEAVRSDVVRFSENNPIICSDKNIEQALNSIVQYLPEMRTMIDRVQAGNDTLKDKGAHSYDVLKHSLKVMQKISQDEKFDSLNASDKKLMLIASLMHDITKKEGYTDKTHCNEGAFDMFFISRKFNLSREEQIKLYTLIKHHEWLSYVNTAKSQAELEKRLQSTAYDLRHDNLLDLSLMFSHADLRAVKEDDSFHDKKEGDSRIDFNGEVRSFGEACDLYGEKLKEYISELRKSQPILPVTKIPSAEDIKQNLTVNPDGSTNVKGVYVDKDGLVVIKFNEVEDWEKIGFPKGSVSRGITQSMYNGEQVDTGNIKFIAHGLDYANQLTKFDAFSLVDSDALLSVSYAERPESKYRFFRSQGVLLDVDTKDIHGGGNTDSGSGVGKNIDTFKQNYIFGGERESDRLYISELVKNALNFSDEEYIDFVRKNSDKSFIEIEPAEVREKLIKAFASINSNTRHGNREYNEMYISNPKPPMAVFAYSIDYNEKIDDPLAFLNRDVIRGHEKGFGNSSIDISVKDRTSFLRQYAIERNIPFFIFGD